MEEDGGGNEPQTLGLEKWMAEGTVNEEKDPHGGAGGDTLSSFCSLRRRGPGQEASSTGDAEDPSLIRRPSLEMRPLSSPVRKPEGAGLAILGTGHCPQNETTCL